MSERFDNELASIGKSLDSPGPAMPIEEQAAESMVHQALQGRDVSGWQLSPWLAAAAALLACSVAAGLYISGVLGGGDEPVPKPTLHSKSAVPSTKSAVPSTTERPSVDRTLRDDAAVTEAPGEEPEENLRDAPRARTRRGPAQELADANALRARRRWKAAFKTYRRIYVRYPDSSEAYAARLAGAELLLRHLGRPKEARTQFQRVIALSPHGSLAAAARHGLARSYRITANRAQEIAALNDLVLHHPQSPLAKLATERLRSMSESRQP